MRKMIKIANRITAMILCVMIFSSTVISNVAFASDSEDAGKVLNKTESVYINTDCYGNVTKVNIFNDYNISNVDQIIDYGEYDSIEVITGDDVASISGDCVTWNTSGEKRLGYMGKTSNELAKQIPWNIEVKYYLNGVETIASELPHQSGLVKVLIKVIPNKEAPEVYQYNYMMEIKASFDMTNYLSVHSEDAIEAQVGNTKSLTFLILPGHEKEVSLEIGTEDFKMDGITFAMVPLEGDVLELVQDVVEDKKKLREAWDTTNKSLDVILNSLSNSSNNLDKIINGTEGIKSGLNSLNDNTDTRLNNVSEAKQSLESLSGDFTRINEQVSSILSDFDYIKQRVNDTNKHLNNISKLTNDLSNNLKDNEKDLERLAKRSTTLKGDLETIEELLLNTKSAVATLGSALSNVNSASSKVNSSLYKNVQTVQAKLNALEAKLDELEDTNPELYEEIQTTIAAIKSNLAPMSEELEDAQDSLKDAQNTSNSASKNLKKLQTSLLDTASIVEDLEGYSKDVPNTIKNINSTVKSIDSMIEVLNDSFDNNLDDDHEKIVKQIDNFETILKETQNIENDAKKIHTTTQNSLSLLEEDINIVSNDIHNNTNKTLSGTQELLRNLKAITNQSSVLKGAKNQIYDIINSDIDDIDNKTTIFKIDPEMPLKSFASEKNESPKKVQIFVQTEAIKEYKKKDTSDLEKEKEKLGFFEKLALIFTKIGDFFKNLFGIN